MFYCGIILGCFPLNTSKQPTPTTTSTSPSKDSLPTTPPLSPHSLIIRHKIRQNGENFLLLLSLSPPPPSNHRRHCCTFSLCISPAPFYPPPPPPVECIRDSEWGCCIAAIVSQSLYSRNYIRVHFGNHQFLRRRRPHPLTPHHQHPRFPLRLLTFSIELRI